jgi:small subunit ribosomal protein S6
VVSSPTEAVSPKGGEEMKAYELLFFVDPTSTDEALAGVSKRIELTVTDNGGTVDSVDDWGKRRLAYEIDGLTEGSYTLVNFHADPTQIEELDRVLRINDNVKRHMIVRRPDKD